MAVNNVHNHSYALLVGLIDEVLKLFGGAKTAARCVETGDVIAKTAIVGVFLYCHELQCVVAHLHNVGQHLFAEVVVSGHALLLATHAYMGFVDQARFVGNNKVFALPAVGLKIPCLRIEDFSLLVLNHATYVGWYALALSAVPVNGHLEFVAMLQHTVGNLYLPVAELQTSHLIIVALLPVAKVANHVNLSGVGCPFAQCPVIPLVVYAVVLICLGKLVQWAATLFYLL